MKKIAIVGAGGHARVVAECIDVQQYNLVGFLDKDDTQIGKEIFEEKCVIGNDREIDKWKNEIDGCIIGIGHLGKYKLRNQLFMAYKNKGLEMINAIHKAAIISKMTKIESGIAIMPGVIINNNAYIGENTIINSGAIIEHDVEIGSGVHVAPGCTISGGSKIGCNAFLGTGCTVMHGIKIGENTIIGAGAVVIKDIPANVVAVGNPARVIKEV